MKKLISLLSIIAISAASSSCTSKSSSTDSTKASAAVSGAYANSSADKYVGSWSSGRCSITVYEEDGKYPVMIRWATNASDYSEWEYSCTYNEDKCSLICDGGAVRTDHFFDSSIGAEKSEVRYTDGKAEFTLSNDKLIWNDLIDNAGKNMLFER